MKKRTKPKARPKVKPKTKSPAKPKAKLKVKLQARPQAEPQVGPNAEERYWSLPVILVVLIYIFLQLPQAWLVRTFFSDRKTYSLASVMSVNVGDLTDSQLDGRLIGLEKIFQTQPVVLNSTEGQWTFSAAELGISFDRSATIQRVLGLNESSLADKLRLLVGQRSSDIEPVIEMDQERCVNTLTGVTVTETAPFNATFRYDQALIIKADRPGIAFDETINCQRLVKLVASNTFSADIHLTTIDADLVETDLETVIDQVQGIIGQPLTLRAGGYQRVLSQAQLLEMLEITKENGQVRVSWSEVALNELADSIAAAVNTYESPSPSGGCQYAVSSGGNWLDKTATKNFLRTLSSGSSRSFTLPIGYHQPVIGEMSPVAAGSSGTVYLTFDDAPTYGNEIMNYAACYGVKVTFFIIGSTASAHAATLQRAIAAGHAIQSHGYIHAAKDYGTGHDYDWQYNDIAQSITEITNVTRVRPTYFRPPGGNRTDDTYRAAADNGLTLILWGVSSADTAGIGSSQICSNVLAGAYPGASVLMHASKRSTASAVPCIIEGLAARGYTMAALR